jgi:hypothetical protein
MRKVLGLTLALLLTMAISAAADEVRGTVKAVDRADRAVILDDGTRLSVSEGQLTDLTPGDQVRAMYETEGGKKVVTGLDHRTIGSDKRGTTNWMPTGNDIDLLQAGD